MSSRMYVVKRNGEKEPVKFDKITARIEKLCAGLDPEYVDPVEISQKVVNGVRAGVTTEELDELAAETAAYQATKHPDFSTLAARISVSNLHKNTTDEFSENIERFHKHTHPKTGNPAPLVSDEVYAIVMANKDTLDAAIDYERDYEIDFFGFKTLERGYLTKLGKKIVERPQQMFLRVALGIHLGDIERAVETYNLMSRKYFIHATPTLFNAGTPRPQMSSCFLLTMRDDSIEGIYDTLKQCAMISKYAGGIGLSVHNIRATDSYIRGTNGSSNGIVPMLRVYSDTARYVDQGGGKRKGSFAIYLEPWHADIFEFLDLKKNHGKEEARARDLFYALWTPDLFMERVEANGDWSLFCPNEAPGLCDAYGDDFRALYERYEREGRARRTVRAQELWAAVVSSQVETGVPYMLYKDAINRKSNQKNLGTIRSSNLCCEIVEYTSPDEVAVCNLASLNLSKFVKRGDGSAPSFDLDELVRVTKVVVRNLNRVIDLNFYPLEEARRSNMRHRPVGLGVQGLADAFMLMRLPFDSAGARRLNRDIFEAMYFGAVTASVELAREEGAYETFPGSPASQGQLQFDMWGVEPSDRWDWASLKAKVQEHGMRNSLLVAPMPTASTSQILGNNECHEPYTSNLYTRRTLAGEFTVVNRHMMRDLLSRGLWTDDVRNQIIADQGSLRGVRGVPDDVKALYKTVWEIKQRVLLDLAADRGAFIDQSQSLNVFMAAPTTPKITAMHFHGWKRGLKTGMYYLRTRPKADAIQFTVDQQQLAQTRAKGGGTSADDKAGPSGAAAGPRGDSPGEEEGETAELRPARPGSDLKVASIRPMIIDSTNECVNCSS